LEILFGKIPLLFEFAKFILIANNVVLLNSGYRVVEFEESPLFCNMLYYKTLSNKGNVTAGVAKFKQTIIYFYFR
jgi:hypothetical protein